MNLRALIFVEWSSICKKFDMIVRTLMFFLWFRISVRFPEAQCYSFLSLIKVQSDSDYLQFLILLIDPAHIVGMRCRLAQCVHSDEWSSTCKKSDMIIRTLMFSLWFSMGNRFPIGTVIYEPRSVSFGTLPLKNWLRQMQFNFHSFSFQEPNNSVARRSN